MINTRFTLQGEQDIKNTDNYIHKVRHAGLAVGNGAKLSWPAACHTTAATPTPAILRTLQALLPRINSTPAPLYPLPCPPQVILLQPKKKEALAWLDGISPTPPARFAKVIVIRGQQRDVMEYMVGGPRGGKRRNVQGWQT